MKTKKQKSRKVGGSKGPEVLTEEKLKTMGMRGLKALVFDRFAQAFSKKEELPGLDSLTKEVKDHFPASRWIANPKIHYSYYKSKFLSQAKA